jgi:putative FmdB family regulatory protein
MPTYEYLCESCGHRFEVLQHIADAPLATCPNCSGHIHRVLFPAGIVFKGSGFYKTDSRGTSTAADPAPTSHESSSASDSNGKSDKPTTTATEAKTESPASAKSGATPASSTSADK